MIAQLKIYQDCESEEPSKAYTCQRLLLKTAKKIDELSRKAAKAKTEEEQTQCTLDILKSIFPSFIDADFEFIDVVEYTEFIREIGLYTSKVVNNAAKN